jgi:hypothetical protein
MGFSTSVPNFGFHLNVFPSWLEIKWEIVFPKIKNVTQDLPF